MSPVDRSDLTFSPDASWIVAINSNLNNQKLYNNIVKELINGILRAFSWAVLSLVLKVCSDCFYTMDCLFQMLYGLGDLPSLLFGAGEREPRAGWRGRSRESWRMRRGREGSVGNHNYISEQLVFDKGEKETQHEC